MPYPVSWLAAFLTRGGFTIRTMKFKPSSFSRAQGLPKSGAYSFFSDYLIPLLSLLSNFSKICLFNFDINYMQLQRNMVKELMQTSFGFFQEEPLKNLHCNMLPKNSGKESTHQSYSDLTGSICTHLCVYLVLRNFIPCVGSRMYYHKGSSLCPFIGTSISLSSSIPNPSQLLIWSPFL